MTEHWPWSPGEVDVAVVVVTYNSAGQIELLLRSLPAALGLLRASVRVVDNGSSDGTADLVEGLVLGLGDLQVVRSHNVGYSAGINRGVDSSPPSRAVLVLNPDIVLEPGSVERLMTALQEPGVGIVAPRLMDEQRRHTPSLRRIPTLGRASGLAFTGLPVFSEYVTDDASYRSRHVVDWATGAVLLVDRECHEALDGWDESYFLYSEETDFCLRASDLGWSTVYEPAVSAMHCAGGSGRNDLTHTLQIVNRVRFYVRRNGPGLGWVYYLLTLASELTWVLRGHPQSWAALRALLRPGRRPAPLGCSDRLLPR
jgi:N-acetylglucosaminyl-diphospho-decaprenol L-rhamnosyltransferase